MDRDISGFMAGLALGMVIGFFMLMASNYSWMNWATESGHAHYDERTGKMIYHAEGE